MIARALSVVVLIAVSAATLLLAQQTPRDAIALQAVGTSSLSGVVVTDEAIPQPLRRVIVTLNGLDVTLGRTAITDDLGRFAFASLPAGRFDLVAQRAAYVTTYYQSRRPGRPPSVPIPLAAGQQLKDVTMKMLRGGVITGTIHDEKNRPDRPPQMRLMMVQTINGERTVNRAFTRSVGADERGVYRFYGLVPGDYVVSASVESFGPYGDVRTTTAADVARAEMALRGSVALSAPTAASPGASPALTEPQMLGYSPIYYPGTPDFASAMTISIGPAEERGGVDFALQRSPRVRITGTVSSAVGLDGITSVHLASQGMNGLSVQSTAADGKTGAFTFSGLSPGTYTIHARAKSAELGSGSAQVPLAADAAVTVADQNLALTLTLRPGISISGKVTVDAASPINLATVRVGLENIDLGGGSSLFAVKPVAVDASGAFTLTDVVPAKYRLTATIPPGASSASPVMVKSAFVNGTEISELAGDVGFGGSVTNAVVTLTDRASELSGTVLNAKGEPTSEYTIVVFSADKRYWTRNSRRLKGPIRPDANGRYVVSGLPPGDYVLAAVADADAVQLDDATLLERLARAGLPITLGDGEHKKQDIRAGG